MTRKEMIRLMDKDMTLRNAFDVTLKKWRELPKYYKKVTTDVYDSDDKAHTITCITCAVCYYQLRQP